MTMPAFTDPLTSALLPPDQAIPAISRHTLTLQGWSPQDEQARLLADMALGMFASHLAAYVAAAVAAWGCDPALADLTVSLRQAASVALTSTRQEPVVAGAIALPAHLAKGGTVTSEGQS